MEIEFRDCSSLKIRQSVSKTVQEMITGDNVGLGMVESATNTADHTAQAVSNLIDLLIQRGVIAVEDIEEITGQKFYSEVKIIR